MKGHEADGVEEDEHGSGGDSRGGNLGDNEVRGFGDGDGGDGFHGLDGHEGAKEEAGGDVVDGGEDESGGEVE
ncbi:unnamed protein product [Camellia sinensis]